MLFTAVVKDISRFNSEENLQYSRLPLLTVGSHLRSYLPVVETSPGSES